MHQLLIERMTLALFRWYAAVVCAGIGSVFGWTLFVVLYSRVESSAWWAFAVVFLVLAMFWLCGGFGYAGFRLAPQLRRPLAPRRWTWITASEYGGSAASGVRDALE